MQEVYWFDKTQRFSSQNGGCKFIENYSCQTWSNHHTKIWSWFNMLTDQTKNEHLQNLQISHLVSTTQATRIRSTATGGVHLPQAWSQQKMCNTPKLSTWNLVDRLYIKKGKAVFSHHLFLQVQRQELNSYDFLWTFSGKSRYFTNLKAFIYSTLSNNA